ncbi:choice-of-anchor Q domain-containing protein [Nocardioides dilutus]
MRRLALLPTALLAPLLVPLVSATPAYAVDNVICVGSPTGVTCNANAATIPAAISLANSNGLPDLIAVGPGTYSDGPYQLNASVEPLTLQGSGEASTTVSLPPSASSQSYIAAQGATVRDLTVVMNAAQSDNDAGVDLYNSATAERVTVTGPGVTNVDAFEITASTASDVTVTLDPTANPSNTGIYIDGGGQVTGASITASYGVIQSTSGLTDVLSRMSIVAFYSGIVTDGGTVDLDDSVIRMVGGDNAIGIEAANYNPGVTPKTVNAEHVTVIGNNATGSVGVLAAANTPTVQQSSTVNLSNSIVRGFATSLVASAANNGSPLGASTATVNASYANFQSDTADIGSGGAGGVNVGPGRLNVDPLFVEAAGGNLRLQSTSPVIDMGDPAAAGPAVDLDSNARVTDGDGDGTARRDMGAFEYQRPPAPLDSTAPQTTFTKTPAKRVTTRKVKFKFTSDEAGVTFQCKKDAKAYKPCTSPLRWKVKLGKHVLRVRAVDAAGNVDPTPARYRFKRLPKPQP